jgi:hypothetical protein
MLFLLPYQYICGSRARIVCCPGRFDDHCAMPPGLFKFRDFVVTSESVLKYHRFLPRCNLSWLSTNFLVNNAPDPRFLWFQVAEPGGAIPSSLVESLPVSRSPRLPSGAVQPLEEVHPRRVSLTRIGVKWGRTVSRDTHFTPGFESSAHSNLSSFIR